MPISTGRGGYYTIPDWEIVNQAIGERILLKCSICDIPYSIGHIHHKNKETLCSECKIFKENIDKAVIRRKEQAKKQKQLEEIWKHQLFNLNNTLL